MTKPTKPEPEKKIKTSVAFPESLWKDGRKRAIDEDCDFQDVVVRALRDYLRKGGSR